MSSRVWKYYEKINKNTSKCKVCGKTIKSSGNTTNLMKHLKSCHSNILSKLSNSPEDTDDDVVSSSLAESDILPNPILRAYELNSAMKEGGSRHCSITNAIAYYLCVDLKPFYAVKTRGFLKLMKTVAPNYKVPSDTHMKKLVSNKYDVLKLALKNHLKDCDSFCLTCDIWTETMTMTSYLGVTIHYIQGTEVKSACIATRSLHERHTAEYISETLSTELVDWGINKRNIKAIVTDNGRNMVAAVNNFFGETSDKHIRCFAHTINLVADKILEEENLFMFIGKVRNIVKYFKKSVRASDELKAAQETSSPKKLILDVKTRWNSCFYMLERFTELASAISSVFLKDLMAPTMLSASELNMIIDIMNLLKPLEFVTRELSGEQYVTVSKIIPIINCLFSKIENLEVTSNLCNQIKDMLLKEIYSRFEEVEFNMLVSVSTILDPRFKNLHFKFSEACKGALNYIKLLLKDDLQPSSNISSDLENDVICEEDDFWQQHKHLAEASSRSQNSDDELSMYLNYPITELKSNPLKTWDDLKQSFPKLNKIFRSHAMIVASSVPAERLFSKAGSIVTQGRNRLKPNRLNELLFLSGRTESEWFDI